MTEGEIYCQCPPLVFTINIINIITLNFFSLSLSLSLSFSLSSEMTLGDDTLTLITEQSDQHSRALGAVIDLLQSSWCSILEGSEQSDQYSRALGAVIDVLQSSWCSILEGSEQYNIVLYCLNCMILTEMTL